MFFGSTFLGWEIVWKYFLGWGSIFWTVQKHSGKYPGMYPGSNSADLPCPGVVAVRVTHKPAPGPEPAVVIQRHLMLRVV